MEPELFSIWQQRRRTPAAYTLCCRQNVAWRLACGSSRHCLSVRQAGTSTTKKGSPSLCLSAESGSIGGQHNLGGGWRTFCDFRGFFSRCPLSRSAALETTSAESAATSMAGDLFGYQTNVERASTVKLIEREPLGQDVNDWAKLRESSSMLNCHHFLWVGLCSSKFPVLTSCDLECLSWTCASGNCARMV